MRVVALVSYVNVTGITSGRNQSMKTNLCRAAAGFTLISCLSMVLTACATGQTDASCEASAENQQPGIISYTFKEAKKGRLGEIHIGVIKIRCDAGVPTANVWLGHESQPGMDVDLHAGDTVDFHGTQLFVTHVESREKSGSVSIAVLEH